MAPLHIKVSSAAMPISTEFFSFSKGLEQFYYVILLASPEYSRRAPAIWAAWAQAGVHLAGKLAPPVEQADKIRVDSRPGVRGFEVTVAAGNPDALGELRALAEDLDAARKSLSNLRDDDARYAALAAHHTVQQRLTQPLQRGLTNSQIPAEQTRAFTAMIRRGLLAITAAEITSMEIAQA